MFNSIRLFGHHGQHQVFHQAAFSQIIFQARTINWIFSPGGLHTARMSFDPSPLLFQATVNRSSKSHIATLVSGALPCLVSLSLHALSGYMTKVWIPERFVGEASRKRTFGPHARPPYGNSRSSPTNGIASQVREGKAHVGTVSNEDPVWFREEPQFNGRAHPCQRRRSPGPIQVFSDGR